MSMTRSARIDTSAHGRAAIMVLTCVAAFPLWPMSVGAQERFRDDFERGLEAWEMSDARGVFLHESEDPAHGQVLVLRPQGDVYALLRGSERWGSVRMEGDVLFPTDEHNYLGFIYNHQRRGDRHDFGLIYIKGNGSYLRVNPHRDFNVGRTLYEEYRTELAGPARIEIGEWQRFKIEVVGRECHVYVGDMDTPQLTFPYLELDEGALGLHPRSVGGDVWVDNVSVTSISEFSYRGDPLPAPDYQPDSILTDWQVAGPLTRTDDRLGRSPASDESRWRPFATDERGAVLSAMVVDYHGPRSVAYFRAAVDAAEAGPGVLHLSTVDDLSVWINGRFHWFMDRERLAWWDFWSNPAHEGQRIPIELRAGPNEIVIRVRGGVYATGGFYARVER